MNILQKQLEDIAKKFMGTNIGHKFPFLITWYFGVKKLLYPKNSLELVSIPLERKLYVSPFSLVGSELVSKGTFEAAETAVFLKLIKEGDVVIDIGANIGYYTVLGSALSKHKLLAIEPDPFNLPILEKNIKENGLMKVTIAPYAVGDHEGKVSLSNETDHAQTQIALDNGQVIMKTLPSIMSEFGFDGQVDFLKIDTEGAERMVLLGATSLFEEKRIQKIFIEINEKKLKTFNATVDEIILLLQRYFSLSLFEQPDIEVDFMKIKELLKTRDYVNILGKTLN